MDESELFPTKEQRVAILFARATGRVTAKGKCHTDSKLQLLPLHDHALVCYTYIQTLAVMAVAVIGRYAYTHT